MNEDNEKAARAAFRKSMSDLNTILDSERIDSLYRTVKSTIRVYDTDGVVSVYGQDEAARGLKKEYPELFRQSPRIGGTPPRPIPGQPDPPSRAVIRSGEDRPIDPATWNAIRTKVLGIHRSNRAKM